MKNISISFFAILSTLSAVPARAESVSISVSASVRSICDFTATKPTARATTGANAVVSSLSVTCTRGTPYELNLSEVGEASDAKGQHSRATNASTMSGLGTGETLETQLAASLRLPAADGGMVATISY